MSIFLRKKLKVHIKINVNFLHGAPTHKSGKKYIRKYLPRYTKIGIF